MNFRASFLIAAIFALAATPSFAADKSKKAADNKDATSWSGTVVQDGNKLLLRTGMKGKGMFVLVADNDASAEVKKTINPDNKSFGKTVWLVTGKLTEDDGREVIHVASIKADPNPPKAKK